MANKVVKKTTTKKVVKHYPVIKQNWEESESGWGVKPDGYSLHLTEDDRKSFIKDFEKTLPKDVPSIYERPSGYPSAFLVELKEYKLVKKSKNGIRHY